jgi:flagellar hook protein FlgE
VDYAAGDKLQLTGVDAANNPVNVQVAVDNTTTLGDLVNDINANFAGVTASIDGSGNLVVKANATGPTNLSVAISDVAGGGTTNWINHQLNTTTTGRNGDTVNTGIQVYDSQGAPHNVNLVFQKVANNTWNLTASINAADGTMINGQVNNITFNADGSFHQTTGNAAITVQFAGFATPQTIGFNFGSANGFDGLTQVGGSSSAAATSQNGFAAGFLTDVSVGQDGTVRGIFTNGQTLAIAQMAVANFANPAALNRAGSNYYTLTPGSGPALIGTGQSGSNGAIEQKQLESSNVDVALEFTRLIIAQNGFQVNARMITASDQVLQDLANILH